MTTETTKKRMTKGRVAGGTVVAAALAATAFFGLSPTAQAAESASQGPVRATLAEAEADLPGLEQQCRGGGGEVVSSHAAGSSTPDGNSFTAVVVCRTTDE